MKKFVFEVVVFSVLVLSSFWLIFYCFKPRTSYYIRLTTPPQESLILGTSRAVQGLVPSVLMEKTGYTFFNFSFSNKTSPYGKVYYDAIVSKTTTDAEQSFFILSVDPWSISNYQDSENGFREEGIALDLVTNFNAKHPNLDFLLFQFGDPFYRLIYPGEAKRVSDDGWLKVHVPMNDHSIVKRENRLIANYSNTNSKEPILSEYRISYLTKTIKFLGEKGNVLLVYLPVGHKMRLLEESYFPNFFPVVDSIISISNCSFLNFEDSISNFKYTDGHHLYFESAYKISEEIASYINQNFEK